MPSRKIAKFAYYGSSREKDREVSLVQNPDGSYAVLIEGYPDLTRGGLTEEKAREILQGWRDFSMKDWGASEIEWLE